MDSSQAARYLALLGVPADPPSLSALTALVTAHLSRVPFENVSKLLQRARGEPPVLVPLDCFLDGVEGSHLGSTCYACAGHFNALLRHLGYEARLCGAAMSLPDVHAVNVVHVGGHDHLVDVGYGAPFFAPLPLDARERAAVTLGRERYVLHPRDERLRTRLDHLRDGQVVHGYVVDPTPRDIDHFAPVIEHSFRPESEFLNRLRIVRHRPECSIALSDFHVTVVQGEAIRRTTLPDRAALCDVVEVLFGIPGALTAEALGALDGRR